MKIQPIIMAALMVCVAASCSRAPRLKLCNQTGVDVEIRVEEWAATLAEGATGIFTFPFKTGRLVVTTDSHTWQYDFPYPPLEYCQPTGAAIIHAQLEPDGRIFVFLPKTPLPASDKSAQPAGFPLKPIEEKQ